jgi:hypothetical protein
VPLDGATRRVHGTVAAALPAATACAASMLVPAGAEAAISCSYSELLPPGPEGNSLVISASAPELDVAAVQRSGEEVVVSDDVTGAPVACAGEAPTVTNTDAILLIGASGTGLAIDERGGPFAPGATDEGDGFSEIEFDLDWEDGLLALDSAPRGEGVSFGTVPGGLGINLNPGSEPVPDIDVDPGGVLSVVARGLGGGESLTAAGGPGFIGPFIRPVSFVGRGGRDLLIGSSVPDLLDGGPGGDRIAARDGKRDRIRCGGGRDRVRADRKDHLAGC